MTPLIHFTQKHGKLNQNNLGELDDESKIEVQIARLKKSWEHTKKKPGKNQLFRAILHANRFELMLLMGTKLIECSLKLASPYLIRIMVDYIKTGENQFSDILPFWEIKDVSWLTWLTPQVQYGIAVALVLVLTQFVAYIIEENSWFWQQRIGAKAMNTLGGFIYEKQLQVSPATNKKFNSGQIINFVQTDAQKFFIMFQQIGQFMVLPY